MKPKTTTSVPWTTICARGRSRSHENALLPTSSWLTSSQAPSKLPSAMKNLNSSKATKRHTVSFALTPHKTHATPTASPHSSVWGRKQSDMSPTASASRSGKTTPSRSEGAFSFARHHDEDPDDEDEDEREEVEDAQTGDPYLNKILSVSDCTFG